MEWSILLLVGGACAFLLWQRSKRAQAAEIAATRLNKDQGLFEHIKAGMREYNFRDREGQLAKAKDRQLLFETAHLLAFHVDHFAETRVGFYFQDIDEFGLYGFFAGNGDETFETYYRSDREFEKEELLMAEDDDK